MATESGPPDRQKAVAAAVRRFPQSEIAIRGLMDRSEAFRDMCEELAEAELALSRVDAAPPPLREARRAEWQELVDRLVGEVRAAIRNPDLVARARIIPWPRR
jgi:hypothetical protein